MNPLILPTVPMAFAFLLPLLSQMIKSRRFVNAYAIVVTGLTLLPASKLLLEAYSSDLPLVYAFGGWSAPVGIVYEVDRFGALMTFVTAFLMFLIAIYSIKYLEHDEGVEWFYTLYLGLEAGLLGLFMTGDAFNLFVMLEVTAIASYGLVMFYTEEGYPAYSGVRYAIISSIGTTMYFLALGVLYYGIGTLNFADLAAKLRGIPFPVSSPLGDPVTTMAVVLALATWAFTIKAAIVPNHFWLPGAHSSAPSPVSAVLSGLVVNAGIYGFMRFFMVTGGVSALAKLNGVVSLILIILGAVSALLASTAMLVQEDVKRIVAYSTILNMGYIAMAVGVGTADGTRAAIFHMLNHALAKALLFLAVGVFIHSAGTRKVSELAGLGKKMPLTTVSLAIATVSLVGLPPTNVFFSKLLLYEAYLNVSPLLVVILVLTSLFALASYMRMLYWLWVMKPAKELSVKESPLMVAVLLSLAAICLVSGVLSPVIIEKCIEPAVGQIGNVEGYIKAVMLYVGK
ncbi:proton-conducting transporter transmembrane domain-containing protein [Thermococcus barophilus]|uniref:Membrane bound subgroup 4b [NiFe]-hydrogenase MBH(B)1, subunit Mbh(B)1H n=1 Tax=Thermococcus barophilus TaxID=55802 RepID=A0A0S1X9Z7_THEBA|nr:proton-conducting transporter membrane subunit [Thermococcus barophilus]ALM74605.1 Membrane bound subgroup 4b [NiFe]-hydrogenase MBH(b)1, subunit Mbh(b)1H'' [Thermococcus barophilus]